MTSEQNNPIGFLQEICQKYHIRFPTYEETRSYGPDHYNVFTTKCRFEGYEANGTYWDKKNAKTESARAMIAILNENHYFDQFSRSDSNNTTVSLTTNPISALNEFCQQNSILLPKFTETFFCECTLNNKKTYGNGANKNAAKTEAALRMCVELNIKCGLESQIVADSHTEKHPVSALDEIRKQNPYFNKVEYCEMPTVMNLFVIKCTFNSISCEGRGTSKKIAKTHAASLVLAKLLAQPGNGFKSSTAMTSEQNNPIGFLQEICQKYHIRFPTYEETRSYGPDHYNVFTTKCRFEGYEANGTYWDKKNAKTESASAMIAILNENHYFDQFSRSDSNNPTISALNEFCQQNSILLPKFTETFFCECTLNNKKTYGNGAYKKAAKTEAALRMCVELNIKCGLESQIVADSHTEKHPVSALDELCKQNPYFNKVEYCEMPTVMNLFVIKCTFNSISCEGRGTSKKIAKTHAASLVLAKLLAQPGNGLVENNVSTVPAHPRVLASSSANAGNSSKYRVLEDFILDSSDDEEEKDSKENTRSTDVNVSVKLEALSLEPEPELEDVSNIKSEENTNEDHQSEPAGSSNLG